MKSLITLITTISVFLSFAQNPADTSYWTKGGVSSLTFSQVGLTNWAAGGQNSVAINSILSVYANRIKGRGKWENSLDLAYGLVKQGEADFAKSDDLINLVSKYSYNINEDGGKWFFSGLMDFRTQFYEGLDEEGNFISEFMAPGYLTVGLGISYDPSDKLSFSYQPVTGKFTFVRNQTLANAGAYGVDAAVFAEDGSLLSEGSRSRSELGSFFRAKYKNDIFESRLELFTNYREDFGVLDVNWQNALVMQLTKVLSMNAFAQLIYDKDIKIGADDNGDGVVDENTEVKDRVQFKSVLGVGLTYRFGVQKEE